MTLFRRGILTSQLPIATIGDSSITSFESARSVVCSDLGKASHSKLALLYKHGLERLYSLRSTGHCPCCSILQSFSPMDARRRSCTGTGKTEAVIILRRQGSRILCGE